MNWGSQLEYLEKLRDEMGIMPKGLAERPDVHDLGGELQRAFNTLSSSRQYGMGGPLPITVTEMAAYCTLFEIADLDERATFVATMQRLDSAYMEEMARRSATSTKSEVVNDGPAIDNSRKG